MTDDLEVPDLGDLVQELTVRQQRYERSLAAALGVDRTSLEVVYQLLAEGPSTPSELARRTGLSTAVVTQVVNRLEAATHVHRSRHASDGRKTVVTVDDETAALAESRVQPLVDAVDALVERLDPRDRRVVGDFLLATTRAYRDHT